AGENKAHRAAYRIFKGEIPAGLKVLHSCDTRCCVNPEHLRLGTQAENIADMIVRGRQKSSPRHGEDNPMAKASWDVVNAIREAVSAGAKQVDMAKRYGLSPMAVSRIVRKESWQ